MINQGERPKGPEFAEQVRPHLSDLLRLAYRFTGNRHDAEDLVQELLVRVYPRRRQLERVDNLRTWLTKILYRLYIDSWRRQRKHPVEMWDPTDALKWQQRYCEFGEEGEHNPDRLLEQMRLQHQLLEAMTGLNEDQRSLILMHDVEGYSLPELSEIVDVPLGTLKSRLFRARARLRQYLEKEA